MILRVFTKGDGPEDRDVKDLGASLQEEGLDVEYYDLEEADSDALRELYDIYSNPTLVVCQNDGKVVEIWRGTIPPVGELTNYMRL